MFQDRIVNFQPFLTDPLTKKKKKKKIAVSRNETKTLAVNSKQRYPIEILD